MAITELEGNIIVHGRFGSLQVAQDGFDTRVAVVGSATHIEVAQESQFQRIFWSLTGAADEWYPLPPGARDESGSPFRIALTGTPTYVYFRKARKIRHITKRPGLAGQFGGNFNATTGVPALTDGDGIDKSYFYVDTGGTYDPGGGAIVFVAGDWIQYDGASSSWVKATEDPRTALCDDVIGKLTVTFTED